MPLTHGPGDSFLPEGILPKEILPFGMQGNLCSERQIYVHAYSLCVRVHGLGRFVAIFQKTLLRNNT